MIPGSYMRIKIINMSTKVCRNTIGIIKNVENINVIVIGMLTKMKDFKN